MYVAEQYVYVCAAACRGRVVVLICACAIRGVHVCAHATASPILLLTGPCPSAAGIIRCNQPKHYSFRFPLSSMEDRDEPRMRLKRGCFPALLKPETEKPRSSSTDTPPELGVFFCLR